MTSRKDEHRRTAAEGRIRLRLASANDILLDAIGNYRTNGDTNQAAAIALYAILSIIPLFILTLLLVNMVFSADPAIRAKFTVTINQFVPSFSENLIAQVGRIEGKREVLGGVGIISLIWFSAMIFGAIQKALIVIFRSRVRRNYLVAKLLALSMIPMGWAVGVASVGLSYVATVLAHQPILLKGGVFFLPTLQGILFRYLFPYVLTVIFFAVVYKVIPTGKISLKSALIGSAIFSALIEIAKQFFTWYVANYTRYHAIFGSLETVVILVVWVFYIALIFLFCAELIASYERRDMILIEKALLHTKTDRLLVDERLYRKFGRLYGKDEYIFCEGDVGQDLFYILNGRVRMEKGIGQLKKTLAEMGPGEYFGEMAALISEPRTASSRCIEECHIAVVSGDTMRDILREREEVSLFMLKEFSNRVKRTSAALEELTQSWVSLMVTLYFFRTWPLSADRNPLGDLAMATGEEPVEILEVMGGLQQKGVLSLEENRVVAFSAEKALQLIDEQVIPS
jgi:membrane protein